MSGKRKYCLSSIPFPGQKKAKLPELAKKILDPNLYDLDFYYTKARGDAGLMAQEARYRNIDAVIAVGGDGTINEVASELINSETALGVIPFGSGNGFARHLHIPLDTLKAVQLINAHPVKKVDACFVNELAFFNVAGIGFDAYVSYIFSTLPGRGFTSYVKASWRAFFGYKPFNIEIQSKDKNFKGSAYLASFANTCQFGNNCYINPSGEVDDGQLEMVVFKPFPIWRAPVLVYKLFNKTIHKSRYVETWSTDAATIIPSTKLKMHIDGDAMAAPDKMEVRIGANVLRVIAI